MSTGNLVSITECFDFTAKYIFNESVYRTLGDPNFYAYALTPSIDIPMIKKGCQLSENITNQGLTPSSKNNQYVMQRTGEAINNDEYFAILNKANLNRYDDWSEREYYNNNIYLLSPIKSKGGLGYSCTCRKYLDEYVCEHALAVSIQTNSVPESIKLNLPLRSQRRKRMGRPLKAVKGPYLRQPIETPKVKAVQNDITTLNSGSRGKNGCVQC